MMIYYLLAALAIYRLSRMIALEEGPFRWFAWIQSLAEKQDTWIKRGIHCPLCLSWWIALPASLFFSPKSAGELLILWGGLAGAAAFIYLQEGRTVVIVPAKTITYIRNRFYLRGKTFLGIINTVLAFFINRVFVKAVNANTGKTEYWKLDKGTNHPPERE